jgi:hypothetical protein
MSLRQSYKAAQQVLADLVDENNKPIFKTVELDNGQMDRLLGEENHQGVIFFPAVFIRFTNIDYDAYTQGVRRGEATMIIKIVLFDTLGFPVDTIFDYRDFVDMALMDGRYDDEHLAVMDMPFEDMPPSYDNIVMWEMHYRIGFYDDIAYRYRNHKNALDPCDIPDGPVDLVVNDDVIGQFTSIVPEN